MAEFKNAFEKGNMFASGLAVDYGAGVVFAKPGGSAEHGDRTDFGRQTGWEEFLASKSWRGPSS